MSPKVCPAWVGYLLVSPLRKVFQSPEKILGPYVEPGKMVLEIGCAMGFFSLPLARMVGKEGKIVCVDIQEKMLRSLRKRALKARVDDRIIIRLCDQNSLGLKEFDDKIDFTLAFAVVHEVPDVSGFFGEVSKAMKSVGRCLVAEPKAHVSLEKFEATLSLARDKGFLAVDRPKIAWSHAALLARQ